MNRLLLPLVTCTLALALAPAIGGYACAQDSDGSKTAQDRTDRDTSASPDRASRNQDTPDGNQRRDSRSSPSSTRQEQGQPPERPAAQESQNQRPENAGQQAPRRTPDRSEQTRQDDRIQTFPQGQDQEEQFSEGDEQAVQPQRRSSRNQAFQQGGNRDRPFDEGRGQQREPGTDRGGSLPDQESFQDQSQELNLGAQFAETGSNQGITVSSVGRQSLAAEIGLEENDQIVSVAGNQVTSPAEVNALLLRYQSAQQRIPLVVQRGASRTTLYVWPQMIRQYLVLPAPGGPGPGLGIDFAPGYGDRLIVQSVTGGIGRMVGLQPDDILVAVNGQAIASPSQFRRIVFSAQQPLQFVVIRNNRRIVLYYDPNLLPGPPYGGGNAWLGVTLDARYSDAAVVREVIPDSPAERAGLRRGDWIVRMDGRRVDSAADLSQIIDTMEPGDDVQIQVVRRISPTLHARLAAEAPDQYRPQRMARPLYDSDWTYDPYGPQPQGYGTQERLYYRGTSGQFAEPYGVEGFDANGDQVVEPYGRQTFDARGYGPGTRSRIGPGERGLLDRWDRNQVPNRVAPR